MKHVTVTPIRCSDYKTQYEAIKAWQAGVYFLVRDVRREDNGRYVNAADFEFSEEALDEIWIRYANETREVVVPLRRAVVAAMRQSIQSSTPK